MNEALPLRLGTWTAPLVLAALALSMACGSPNLPSPKLAAHPASDLQPVDYPPPPARAEVIPPQPEGDAVWVDGEWSFRGKKWRWRRGRWVELRSGSDVRFAPWTSVRSADGQLFVAEGAWLDGKGTVVAAPRVLAEAPPSKSIVVNERGEDEDVGRDIREPRDGGARTRERQESDKDGGAP